MMGSAWMTGKSGASHHMVCLPPVDAEFWESGSVQSPSGPRFGTWANCFLCVPLAKAGHNLIPNSDSMREKIHFTSWEEELQSHFAKGYDSRKGNN